MHRIDSYERRLRTTLLVWVTLAGCQRPTATTPESPAQGPAPAFSYVPTTGLNEKGVPARVDLGGRGDFILCNGTFALCYYSGPTNLGNPSAPDLSCTVTSGPQKMANCNCLRLEDQDYKVDINAILERSVYDATVEFCTNSGVDCGSTANAAPVCRSINTGALFAGAASISAFSTALDKPGSAYAIRPTQCDTPAKYAGCMTAPCVATNHTAMVEGTSYKIDTCTCPTWTGPFQVGTEIDPTDCTLDGDGSPGTHVWSAAYTPPPDPGHGG